MLCVGVGALQMCPPHTGRARAHVRLCVRVHERVRVRVRVRMRVRMRVPRTGGATTITFHLIIPCESILCPGGG